jgi:hypothetical protein
MGDGAGGEVGGDRVMSMMVADRGRPFELTETRGCELGMAMA